MRATVSVRHDVRMWRVCIRYLIQISQPGICGFTPVGARRRGGFGSRQDTGSAAKPTAIMFHWPHWCSAVEPVYVCVCVLVSVRVHVCMCVCVCVCVCVSV